MRGAAASALSAGDQMPTRRERKSLKGRNRVVEVVVAQEMVG